MTILAGLVILVNISFHISLSYFFTIALTRHWHLFTVKVIVLRIVANYDQTHRFCDITVICHHNSAVIYVELGIIQ